MIITRAEDINNQAVSPVSIRFLRPSTKRRPEARSGTWHEARERTGAGRPRRRSDKDSVGWRTHERGRPGLRLGDEEGAVDRDRTMTP